MNGKKRKKVEKIIKKILKKESDKYKDPVIVKGFYQKRDQEI